MSNNIKNTIKTHLRAFVLGIVVILLLGGIVTISRMGGFDMLRGSAIDIYGRPTAPSPTLQFITPKPGDVYKPGDTVLIQWTPSPARPSAQQAPTPSRSMFGAPQTRRPAVSFVVYTITLGTPSGNTVIGTATNTTSLKWVVPMNQKPSDRYQLFVKDNGKNSGFLNGFFSIGSQAGSSTMGTLQISQNGGLGTVTFSGPSSGTVQTAISTWPNTAQPGAYTLSSIVPPSGFILRDVTDISKKPLTAPYAQTLVAGGTIWYNVNYAPETTRPVCGNGKVEVPEVCDSGSQNSDAYGLTKHCNSICAGFAPYCGDGQVAMAFGEQCDDGNSVSGDGCSVTCQKENPTPPVATTGTITVTQLGAVGKLTLAGPSSQTVTVAGNTYPSSIPGEYTLSVEPPAGFSLSSVQSKEANGSWKELAKPDYKQTLVAGGSINYYPNYISNETAGGLLVNYLPAQLIGAGFEVFKVDGDVLTSKGSYNSSYSLGSIPIGTYTVVFKEVQGYTKPADQTVTLTQLKPTATVNAEYKQILAPVTPAGTLAIETMGSPQSKILIAGASMQFVSKYRFSSLGESFTVKRLTVINDLSGSFDAPQSTAAVSKVVLKYTDANGVSQTALGALSAGANTFSGLSLYVPANQDSYAEIYADISAMSDVGEALSGQTFRLGIKESSNNVSTFEAVGATSNASVSNPTFNGSSAINAFVVRRSAPIFSRVPNILTGPGVTTLYGINVSADPAGPIALGRLTFMVQNLSSATLSQFQFFRNQELISASDGDMTRKATIHDGARLTDLAGTGSLPALSTSGVVVSFNQEEIINAGQSVTYYLKATVVGPYGNNEIKISLHTGDDATQVAGITGSSLCGPNNNSPCSTGNGNTGAIYNVQVNRALFFKDSDFFTRALTPVYQVWSDMSADAHSYPTVNFGTPNTLTSSSGSYDWTNGYLWGLSSLTPVSLSY